MVLERNDIRKGLTTGIIVSLLKEKWKLTLTDSFYSKDNIITNSVLMTSCLYLN